MLFKATRGYCLKSCQILLNVTNRHVGRHVVLDRSQITLKESVTRPRTQFTLVHKMASKFEEGRHWAQVIFTHDSKPPVLIDKEQITLGRKEGTRTGYKRQSNVKDDYSPFNIMYTQEIDQLVRFFILYIIWLTCSFRQITFQG